MSRQPPGIMARIRQMRQTVTAPAGEPSPPAAGVEPLAGQVAEIRARLAHLEQLVQGLQDSVHRSSERHDKRMSDIENRLDPAALAAALSKDARERGI
jgi:hypothetical protein